MHILNMSSDTLCGLIMAQAMVMLYFFIIRFAIIKKRLLKLIASASPVTMERWSAIAPRSIFQLSWKARPRLEQILKFARSAELNENTEILKGKQSFLKEYRRSILAVCWLLVSLVIILTIG